MGRLISKQEIDALYKKVGITEELEDKELSPCNKLNTGTMHNRLSSSFNSKMKLSAANKETQI